MANRMKDKELRLELVKAAGFSLDELPLVYQFVKGNDEALTELATFREWKRSKEMEEFNRSL